MATTFFLDEIGAEEQQSRLGLQLNGKKLDYENKMSCNMSRSRVFIEYLRRLSACMAR
jgi:hypothetical protein